MQALTSFITTINQWISFLGDYTLEQLQQQPAPGSWSMGQMYMHLVADTNFYIGKMKEALIDTDNVDKEIHPDGKIILEQGFPDVVIVGHPNNAFIKQPLSKQELLDQLNAIKNEVNNLVTDLSNMKGKSEHPGLKFFTAEEWIRFADRHMQHHFRQKKRIDQFLSSIIR